MKATIEIRVKHDKGFMDQPEVARCISEGSNMDSMILGRSKELLEEVSSQTKIPKEELKIMAPRVWSPTIQLDTPRHILGIFIIEVKGALKQYEVLIGSDCIECDDKDDNENFINEHKEEIISLVSGL